MPHKLIENKIHPAGIPVTVATEIGGGDDYISITDIAKHRNRDFPADVVKNWMRLRSTIEFLGLWESLNNPQFKLVEFDQFKNSAGENTFVLSPKKWIKSTGAIGLASKAGRYGGGTFAHKDIAFEFASWVSPEFKLYVILEYQRLKEQEEHRLALDWNVKRILAKANYKMHTDAIKANLIPPELPSKNSGFVYADEADLLNVALFGKTAKEWRMQNPGSKGNMRDYATIEQLLILSNLEMLNSYLIREGVDGFERLKTLRESVLHQIQALSRSRAPEELNYMHNQLKLPTDEP